MNPLRVVLDTNCLVSALVFNHSRLSALRRHWQAFRFVPVGCKETVSELVRVLAYPKFRLSRNEIGQLLEDILPFLETWPVVGADGHIDGLRDAQDAVFIHLARQSGADALVSGDEDILALQGAIANCRIIHPADFLASLG
ncbi:MAG: putative toxin-antitoxin system toxin component, PIN family [Burkholderiaceae bacterium]|jgi:putative PIN family toxin of toxin-antitoxin system|nr:putative toxin-antitoxin system toxin component, PIN family [Burkholderiaceae bacterium]